MRFVFVQGHMVTPIQQGFDLHLLGQHEALAQEEVLRVGVHVPGQRFMEADVLHAQTQEFHGKPIRNVRCCVFGRRGSGHTVPPLQGAGDWQDFHKFFRRPGPGSVC